jgi:formylmethanofuran dehydrogenase subunit D
LDNRASARHDVPVSRNLVKTIRRHHEQGAPTALDVLKEAMDASGGERNEDGERKFIAANGDQGDPGSYNADLLARGVLEMHPDDAARLWIEDGEAISVRSRQGSIEITAEVTDRIERGRVFTTFQFPETRTNLLIGQLADVNTSCPEYNVVAVDVRPIGEQSTMTPALAGAAGP